MSSQSQDEPRFYKTLEVRYADTDAQGHVFFANYLTYFDEAFTGYLHAIGCPPRALVESGVDVVYRDAHCEYLGRSLFEDVLRIGVTMDRIGNTSFTTRYVIEKDAELIARGTLTNVCVDAKTLTKVPVPDVIRDAVARYEAS
jgi:acyl-CoA thioester hydrolase